MALLSAVFSLAEEYRILLDYSYGKLQPRLSFACTVGLIDVYFLTYVALSVYEVVCVAFLLRSWFVYATRHKQTNYATDKPRERLRKR